MGAPPLDPEHRTIVVSRSPTTSTPALIVLQSPSFAEVGKVVPLGDELVVGRGRDAHVVIDDPGISRAHVRISRTHGGHQLIDLGSRNGTFVNGERVREALLADGDRVQLGTVTVLRFSDRERDDSSDSRLRSALSAAAVGVFDLDFHTGLVRWSTRIDRALGLKDGSLSGHSGPLWDIASDEDRPALMEALERARLRLEGVNNLELRLRPDVLGARWVSCTAHVLTFPDGRASKLIGTLADITSRKSAELELRAQLELFESLYDGVVVTDASVRVVDWNASAAEMFGFTRADAVSRNLFELLGAPDPERLTEDLSSSVRAGGRWTHEVETGGRLRGRTFEVVAVARARAGALNGCIVTHRDVTERQRLRAQIGASERLAALGTLSAGMAHEINNPLSFVLANLAFVRDALAAVRQGDFTDLEQCEEVLSESLDGAQRIRSIVANLKLFASGRDESGAPCAQSGAAIASALKLSQNLLRHRAQVTTTLSETRPVAISDGKLVQVLLNLLINAAHAIPEERAAEGRIDVRCFEHHSGKVAIEVRDNGSGMSAEVQARMFEPFFTTKKVGVGTGLGLSLCHGIVTGAGGDIRVQSAPGVGTTFRVLLPASVERPSEAPSFRSEASTRSLNLLVVDDEAALARSIARTLTEHGVTIALDVRQALELAEREHFDAVLCDVMMPGRDGEDLYRELSAKKPELAARMLFMTGGAFGSRSDRFAEEIHERLLLKPLDWELLRRRLIELSRDSDAR